MSSICPNVPQTCFFAPYFLNYESKIFLSNGTFFLPDVCQLRSRHIGKFFTFLNVKFFNQIVANLPYNATEKARFLKMLKIWVFFGKIYRFFEKNLVFFKIAKGGKFAVERVSNGIISQKFPFRPTYEVLLAKKIRKL